MSFPKVLMLRCEAKPSLEELAPDLIGGRTLVVRAAGAAEKWGVLRGSGLTAFAPQHEDVEEAETPWLLGMAERPATAS